MEAQFIQIWRGSLTRLLCYYDTRRGPLYRFLPKLFLLFVAINMSCYWLAMLLVFPEVTFGIESHHYIKVQYPVGVLGAFFDTVSFFVTIWLIRQALKARTTKKYLSHLSIDLLIALVATGWVLFVFAFSGWIIALVEYHPERLPTESLQNEAMATKIHAAQVLATRSFRYGDLVLQALLNPMKNIQNIFFGIFMGISAMLPTCLHLYMSLRSVYLAHQRQKR